ncbi:hypothetical protein [Cohnella ginsengisoli]|uniref:hypothetical protein n=1 Tax=Cohnella ginsengisoli TaxID=425004 RepID=UPI0030B86D11
MAITLDLHLGDTDGWLVLEHLKNDMSVRHIPVCVITVDEDKTELLRKGVYDYLCKPVTNDELDLALESLNAFASRGDRQLLAVVKSPERRKQIVDSLAGGTLKITAVDTTRKALNQIGVKPFDCVVTEGDLTDMPMPKFLREIQKKSAGRRIPIVVEGGIKLSGEEHEEWEEILKTSVVKEARSAVQLMDETTLFLHRRSDELPAGSRGSARADLPVRRGDSVAQGARRGRRRAQHFRLDDDS